MTRSTTIRLSKILIIIIAIILIVGYAIWRSENYAKGPQINIFSPINGSATTSSTISIIGQAERVNSLSLNGKAISTDEAGNFTEKIILFSGINIITLEAKDRFQRGTKEQLKIVGL